MFISNGTVVALGVLLFFVDGLGVEWQVGYATIVVLLKEKLNQSALSRSNIVSSYLRPAIRSNSIKPKNQIYSRFP